MTLDPVQARVLGTLIEKEITTPEYYPLSLNALVAGCNQKSSRQPVMELSEDQVRSALDRLESEELVAASRDARVPKYEHRARTVLNLRRDETAVLCLLLLRGPQTPGELRTRADRMYTFDDIPAVESTLQRLMASPEAEQPQPRSPRPIVAVLPRQAGSREVRYAHLLSGPLTAASAASSPLAQSTLRDDVDPESRGMLAERVRELEGHMDALRAMIARLESRLQREESRADESSEDTHG